VELTVDGAAFLDAARRYARETTEADWRSAISRAYYAVFHVLREALPQHGVAVGRAATAHSNLHLGLLNSGNPDVADLARGLDDLRIERTRADYELTRPVAQSDADRCVQSAQQLLADFQALIAAGLDLSQLATTVRAFLVRIGRLPP
jgi:uncharacterized protein (UPF0332 family)